jgi:asparagine synthase (glutamine-hydrolysing)
MPWELSHLMDRDLAREGLRRLQPTRLIAATLGTRLRKDFSKIAVLESALYMRNQLLRDTDWASMAHSLEVRVPLVDAHLLARCAPSVLATDRGSPKQLLASSPSQPLPEAITRRVKTGFTTPLPQWIRKWERNLARRPETSRLVSTASRLLASSLARTWCSEVY